MYVLEHLFTGFFCVSTEEILGDTENNDNIEKMTPSWNILIVLYVLVLFNYRATIIKLWFQRYKHQHQKRKGNPTQTKVMRNACSTKWVKMQS